MTILLFISSITIFLVLKSLEDDVVYFFSPTEIYTKSNISLNKKIRIGSLVKERSVKQKEKGLNFVITDLKNEIIVSFAGITPNLFSEGKGVIAEGKLRDKKYLIANKILAKHDENYMPPEVSRALEEAK